jgi:hypothetical protein
LNRAGPVAENRKKQFSRLAQVVKPPAQRHFLPVVPRDILNAHYWHGARCSPFSVIPKQFFCSAGATKSPRSAIELALAVLPVRLF